MLVRTLVLMLVAMTLVAISGAAPAYTACFVQCEKGERRISCAEGVGCMCACDADGQPQCGCLDAEPPAPIITRPLTPDTGKQHDTPIKKLTPNGQDYRSSHGFGDWAQH